jgi:beta-fructofuranosidase
MLTLPEAWTWDFWIADTGTEYHLFFLYASRALHDPERRHRRASIGHAVSTDLRTWIRRADAVVRGEAPAMDDVATWTGSTVRGDDGRWYLFYTGCSDNPAPATQRIGVAISDDLENWDKVPGPVLEADSRWYEKAGDPAWFDEAWRDPWVFYDKQAGNWRMLVTARANVGDSHERGVIGTATSSDLVHWTAAPPLSEPGAGFGQLEVPQVECVDGQWLLLFSCLRNEVAERRRADAGSGGVWVAFGESQRGPFDIAHAMLLTDESRYAGRIIQDRDGVWQFLAFRNVEDGSFVGGLADPVPFAPLLERALEVNSVGRGTRDH